MIKNPQANAILERVHQVIGSVMCTAELDMQDRFLSDASWEIRASLHTVLKASPGAAIFGRDM